MNRYRLAAGLALAVLGVLALAGPVAAGDHVPFKGRLEGDVSVTPLAPPFLQVDVEAMGKATQLGQFTLDIPHVVNRANGTAVGTYEFTAANGDTVYAIFTGTATAGTWSTVSAATPASSAAWRSVPKAGGCSREAGIRP